MRGDRCKYTKKYADLLRAHFAHLVDRRGVVRILDLSTGNAQVRFDDSPGELYHCRLTDLVREDHEGADPLDETVIHVDSARVWEG